MRNRSTVRVAAATLMALATLLPATAPGQTTYTWSGGGSDANWQTAANWAGGTAPSTDSGNNVLVFSGSTRPVTNNTTGWSVGMGQLQFSSGAASFTLGGQPFGLQPYLGNQTQQIFQNSVNTQTISTSEFAFRPGADSQINLNAGDLVISSPTMYIDRPAAPTFRTLTVTGTDTTRHSLTFAGVVTKGGDAGGNDPDMRIANNKRVLVTGSLTFGSGNDASVFVDNGVLQFSGAGTMTGGRPLIGASSGTASAAIYLDTAGTTFSRQVEIQGGSSGRRTIGGLNTSGTATYSGDFVPAGTPANYDLVAATGGTVAVSGARNFNSDLYVNRPDGATNYGGTVILSGATNSSGFTALMGGTLQFGDFNQLGSGHFEFYASSGDSGTLRYTGGSTTTTKTLWIDNTGLTRAAIDVSQAATVLTWNPASGTVDQNLTKAGAGTLVYGGGITGAGTVVAEGGLLVVTGSNGYSGGTTVTSGTVEVSGGYGTTGGSAAGLGSGTVSIASGGRVNYWLTTGDPRTVANPFSLSGGTLHTTDGFTTYSGPVTLASGSSTISATYEDTVTFSGGLSGAGSVIFNQSGNSGGKAAPTFVLSAAGTNTGTVRVAGTSGGVETKLQLANVNALQNATLDMATGDVGTVEFTAAGTNTYSLGGLQGSRAVALGANSLTVGGNGSSTTYSGNLSTTGSLTKTGAGTLTLSGSNALAGGTTLNAGTLSLGSSGALGSSGTISFGGGTLQSTAGNTTDYSARFSNAASQAYKIDTNGQNVTLATSLTSVGGTLTKLGAGTLTLSGSHGFTGPTTVQAGTLSLSGTIASSAVTVQSGATLAGTGFLGSSLTIASSGTLAPGNSPGQITSSTLTLEAGSATVLEIVGVTSGTSSLAGAAGTNYDTLVVSTSGGLTYGGALSIGFSNVSPFANGTTFDLFQFTGAKSGVFASIATIGSGDYANLTFTSNPDGSWYTPQTAGQQYLKFDPVTGDLVIVPEPSTWAMVLAGAATVGLLRRRRRA